MTSEAKRSHDKEVLGSERTFEIGKDEAWFANVKRTYDRTEENLQRCFDQTHATIVSAQNHVEELRAVRLASLANMTQNDNALSKQMMRHADVAIDRTWNIDEQSHIVEQILSDQKFQDAMGTLLSKAVGQALNTEE